MKHVSRRAFTSPEVRDCYDTALSLGWTLKPSGKGPHVVLRSPDGSATLVLSTTAVGRRSVANNWSVLKRWQKENQS